jgi:hypothetical protein
MARVYATAAAYTAYTGQTAPADIDRLLARASEVIDQDVVATAWYDTDDAGMPTNTDVLAAFSNAACAQVEFWKLGPGEGVDISGPIQGVSLGGLSIQYGAGDNRIAATTVGPRVYRAFASLPSSVFRIAVGTPGWGTF